MMLRTRSSGMLFLPSLVLLAVTLSQAAMVPVLICVNERANADECAAEKAEAAVAMAPWFAPYAPARRELVDCTRFCHKGIDHFTFHAPCDCTTRRYLQAVEAGAAVPGPSSVAQPATPQKSPIKLFNEFVALLPGGRCKDEVLSKAKCIVNFVSSYQYDKDAIAEEDKQREEVLGLAREADNDEADSGDGDSGDNENNGPNANSTETNNPDIVEVETFDPTTIETSSNTTSADGDGLGDVITTETWDPETNSLTPGSVIDVETFDPSTEEVEEGTDTVTETTTDTTETTTPSAPDDTLANAIDQEISENIGGDMIDEEIFDPLSYDPDTEEVEDSNFDTDAPTEEETAGPAIIDAETFDIGAAFEASSTAEEEADATEDVADGGITIGTEFFDPTSYDADVEGVGTAQEDGGR